MRIRLRAQQGEHMPGSEHEVDHIVPHGGYTDSECQYVLKDGTHVASDFATVVRWTVGKLPPFGIPSKPDYNLEDLLERSRRAWEAMTPEQRAAHREEQRASWVRAFTKGCEHGVLDFEQCPDCRRQRAP